MDALVERVEKCYSAERYEEFQEVVEKIVIRTIDGSGREKIKGHAKEAAKQFLDEDTWRKITFWIPTIVAIIAVIVAIYK